MPTAQYDRIPDVRVAEALATARLALLLRGSDAQDLNDQQVQDVATKFDVEWGT